METDPPATFPTKKGLEKDLGRVLTVGVGQLAHQPIKDLELVAAQLSDRTFPAPRQVEEVVREAITQLGSSTAAIAVGLVFGTDESTKEKPLATRRDKAAKKFGVSEYTLTHDREPRARRELATYLLKRYIEEGGVVAELTASSREDPDESSELDQSEAPSLDDNKAVIDPIVPTEPIAQDDDLSSVPQDDEGVPEASELAVLTEPIYYPETTEAANAPVSTRLGRLRPRPLVVLTAIGSLLVVGIVIALLIPGSAGSGHRRPSVKNFPIIMSAGSSSPGRPVYNYGIYDPNDNCDNPRNPALNYGRCGSMNGPAFDSFINTPYYGDEDSFFYQYPVATDITNGAPEIRLRVYIDNDANPSTDCVPDHQDNGICRQIDYEAIGIAQHARVSINLPNPATVSESLTASASITADDVPEVVRDSAEIEADREFSVSYILGSAIEYNNGPFKKGVQLSDSIVRPKGAPVGYSALERGFPGGFNYAATVEIRLAVHLH